MADDFTKKARDPLAVAGGASIAPAIAAGGADPFSNAMALEGAERLGISQQLPFGPMRYGDPGDLNLPRDASQMPGYGGSPEAQRLAASLAAQRAATSTSDPYAASRENAREMVQANMGHADYQSRQQMLRIRQNMALQQYLQDLENFEREQDRRAAEYDRFGRTAYGGGQAILGYFTRGGFSGNRPTQQTPRRSSQGFQTTPSPSANPGYNPGYGNY